MIAQWYRLMDLKLASISAFMWLKAAFVSYAVALQAEVAGLPSIIITVPAAYAGCFAALAIKCWAISVMTRKRSVERPNT